MAIELASHRQQRVGFFWLLQGRLIIDACPLSEAEPYCDCFQISLPNSTNALAGSAGGGRRR